jgi:hypothetical protein
MAWFILPCLVSTLSGLLCVTLLTENAAWYPIWYVLYGTALYSAFYIDWYTDRYTDQYRYGTLPGVYLVLLRSSCEE